MDTFAESIVSDLFKLEMINFLIDAENAGEKYAVKFFNDFPMYNSIPFLRSFKGEDLSKLNDEEVVDKFHKTFIRVHVGEVFDRFIEVKLLELKKREEAGWLLVEVGVHFSEAKKNWINLVKTRGMAKESIVRLRKILRKTIVFYYTKPQLNVEMVIKHTKKVISKFGSFSAECRSVLDRHNRKIAKKTELTFALPSCPKKIRRDTREVTVERERLLKAIYEMAPEIKSEQIPESQGQRKRLLEVLSATKKAVHLHDGLLKKRNLSSCLQANSGLMQAINSANPVSSVEDYLGLKEDRKRQNVELEKTAVAEYKLLPGTKLILVAGSGLDSDRLGKLVIGDLGADSFEFCYCGNSRAVDSAVESDALIVMPTAINSHKVFLRFNLSRPNVVVISNVNKSTFCQKVIDACLKKGFPLIKVS